jgi:hypothetical protein
MVTALRVSCFAYRLSLALYPHELRHRFGREMTQVFTQHISEQWKQRGIIGIVRVWLTTALEVLTVAAPLQMRNSAVIATALSFVISSVLCLAFFRAVSP